MNMRRYRATLSAALILVAASAARGEMVVQRFGAKGHVQHPDALKYQVVGEAGTVMRFDLAALAKGAKVYRSRLFLFRDGADYGREFVVFPVERISSDEIKAADKPLDLAAPCWRWFDVTDLIRKKAAAGEKEANFLLRSAPRFRRQATFLEIASEGKLTDPPEQAAGLKAVYRSGQVFLTWREIEDLCEGQERYPWGSLIKKLKGYQADGPVPKDEPREIRYRIYRHTGPITPASIGSAELIGEAVPASGVNTRMVQRIWQGEQVPSKLDESYMAVRLAVQPGKAVPSGTGVYVHTVTQDGKAYYAVVTAVDGVENTASLSPDNVAGPIQEKVADPAPVLQAETATPDVVNRRYCYWAAGTLSPRPLQYGLVAQYNPKTLAKPAPLEINHGQGHTVEPTLSRWQRSDAILLALSDDPMLTMRAGMNDCQETLKSYRQGAWAPFPQRRQEKLIEWAKTQWDVDSQQVYVYASHAGLWEIRRPDIYCAVIGWGMSDLTRGFVSLSWARGAWGPPEAYVGKKDEENPWVQYDYARLVKADPARTLPQQFLIVCFGSHTGEMGYPALPIYKRALMDARQPFCSDLGKASWGEMMPVPLTEFRAGRLTIKRDQSKPAFANCSIDQVPGCGDWNHGDYTGLLNGYLLWETETIADEPGRWEMTVYLHSSAPLPECKVDLTPRVCQKFKPAPGTKFAWTNSAADGKVVQQGKADADKYGLVTLERVTISKGKNRIAIVQEGS